jgi:hypothetical protein
MGRTIMNQLIGRLTRPLVSHEPKDRLILFIVGKTTVSANSEFLPKGGGGGL